MNYPRQEEHNNNNELNLDKNNSKSAYKEKKGNDKDIATKFNLNENEYILFQTAVYEYNDLFPEILNYNKATFFASLERYILIHLSPKNISFPNGTFNKIMKIH